MIFNPASGRGRGASRMARYRALLDARLTDVSYGATTRAGEERELAQRAVDDGYDVIVAVGGDGTWSNAADGILRSGRSEVALGILPSGTGNDFGRNFGHDAREPGHAVDTLAAGHTRFVDVGVLDTPSASEHEPERFETRHFLNVVGFGFDVAVIEAAKGARLLRGELLYKVTALQQLFRFPGLAARVQGNDRLVGSPRHLMVTVSNGRFFGGGFPIAPPATVDDGQLHACSIGDAPPLSRLKLFNLAERGRHTASERVDLDSGDAFVLEFDAPPRFEMDGELRQANDTVLSLRSLPSALQVVAPGP